MSLRDLPHPFSRPEAEAAGIGRRRLEELLRLAKVRRVRRGWYVVMEDPAPPSAHWEQLRSAHLDQVREHLRRLPGHVASHTSAALLHGYSVLISPHSPIELTTVDRCPRSWREDRLVVHHSDSHDIPVTQIDGLRVTSAARTAADTLRSRRLPHGTALVDQALRSGVLSKRQLLDELSTQRRWVGRPRALAAVALGDPRRETWLESYSFVALYERGVPMPIPQMNMYDDQRNFVGRVDGLDPEKGIFFEADGHDKYFLDMNPTTSPEESALRRLHQEKQRHGRIERLGLRGVRWTSDEILNKAERVASRVMEVVREPIPEIRGYAGWEGELRRLPFEVERSGVDLHSIRTRRRRRAA
ncbi:MAG: hypothetical protein Q4P07_02215 [Ornithinimicrobium sp.]|uniref:hypothetical protein n=1 Tax=Ornithinimicrobium sp. TaxID=1977084 RepID=UPI0026E10A77|nr:hypothetical protein [Ornithinimicrobium sp.]MDO5738943.1 hypothetical protein [Ornithinimicrobium sp.]